MLVSQEVVEAASGGPLSLIDIGPVALKGVIGALRLHTATDSPERPLRAVGEAGDADHTRVPLASSTHTRKENKSARGWPV